MRVLVDVLNCFWNYAVGMSLISLADLQAKESIIKFAYSLCGALVVSRSATATARKGLSFDFRFSLPNK